jgi:hypothetical protein
MVRDLDSLSGRERIRVNLWYRGLCAFRRQPAAGLYACGTGSAMTTVDLLSLPLCYTETDGWEHGREEKNRCYHCIAQLPWVTTALVLLRRALCRNYTMSNHNSIISTLA